MGSQIKLVVGAGIVAQTVGQAKPPQRKAAELLLTFAHAGLGKAGVVGGKVQAAVRRKALPHAVALTLDAVVKNVCGGVLVQQLKIFGVEQPRPAGELHRHVRADGHQQPTQPRCLAGTGVQFQHFQTAAVGKQVTAKAVGLPAQPHPAQLTAVIKGRTVNDPHRVGQGDFLYKIAGDFMGVGAVRGPQGTAGHGPVGKTIGADLHHRQAIHGIRHHRAGRIAQHPQHPRTARAALPYHRHKNHPFTLPTL